MRFWSRTIHLSLIALVLSAAEGFAQPSQSEVAASAKHRAQVYPLFQPGVSETQHQIQVNGKSLRYLARAGYMNMLDESGKLKANLFFIAYEKLDVRDRSSRPITFVFNGGPGSSSVWLHMGALGPRRVKMGDAGEALPAPYGLTDNEHTWLDFTDLVFIDPVMTGYSRPAEGEDKKQFHGVKEDVQSVGEFIRLYTTKYQRWLSPKFLAGESYGTTRAAGLSGYLLDRYGMYLSGIALISSILQFGTARFDVGNDLPYVLFLPTYTATAWFHNKLPADLQQDLRKTLDEVEQWALTDYWLALAKGDQLSAQERQQVIDRLARYTGLSKQFIDQADLRIVIYQFVKELLRDQKRTVGRLDSRFTGIDRTATGERFEYDPSYAAIYGPFTAAVNHYLRAELNYENDLIYEILTRRVRPWNWRTDGGQGYVNVAETLRQAMTKNPYLQVFIANGYYDLATPYFATEYTVSHMQLDPSLRQNIHMAYYESGHMMYIHLPSLQKFTRDVREFYQKALRQAVRNPFE